MSFQMSMEFIATLCSALFAGAAIYIHVAEHPARMSCGAEAARTQWAPSYNRGRFMQAPLAFGGLICAVLAWFAGASVWWFVGGVIQGLVIPFTLLVIKPVNQLLFDDPGTDAERTRTLLDRWNSLHAVRTACSLTALIIFLLVR